MDQRKIFNWLMSSICFIVAIGIYVLFILVGPCITKGIPTVDWKNTLPQDGNALTWTLYIMSILAPGIAGECMFQSLLFGGISKARDTQDYKDAMTLLRQKIKSKKQYVPISPVKWMTKTQITKSLSIVFGTISSVFMITSIVLYWDTNTFIALLVSLTFSLSMSIKTYFDAYKYYTTGIKEYAEYITKEESIDGNN